MDGIYGFDKEYRWLSNFYPVKVWYDGMQFPSVEHAYQAAKTLDKEIREVFTHDTLRAGRAKNVGSHIDLRPDWNEETRIEIMYSLLLQKFSHPSLREKLLATGDLYIEETNYWKDTFWGVCNGVGENRLGNILMQIRNDIRKD